MNSIGLNRPPIGGFAGQLKEYLEFQKSLGRSFLPRPLQVPKPPGFFGRGVPRPTYDSLPVLFEAIIRCCRCPLSETRRQALPGQGASKARLMFIGEGPEPEEDQQGRTFVGPAGLLLTKMIQAINLNREEVYITHAVKCRPPEDRPPLDDELEACQPFLKEEIRLVDPKILVALGGCAARILTGSKEGISALRGRWLDVQGKRLIVSYQPDFLLKNPGAKRAAWEDLKKVRRGYDGLE